MPRFEEIKNLLQKRDQFFWEKRSMIDFLPENIGPIFEADNFADNLISEEHKKSNRQREIEMYFQERGLFEILQFQENGFLRVDLNSARGKRCRNCFLINTSIDLFQDFVSTRSVFAIPGHWVGLSFYLIFDSTKELGLYKKLAARIALFLKDLN